MTLKRPSKLTYTLLLGLLWVLLPQGLTHADYEAPSYVEIISRPIYIPSVSIGATYQNRQITGTEFCVTGGFRHVLKDPYIMDTTDSFDGWVTGDFLADVSDTDGGATTLNLLTLVNAHGAGYYGLFSNNSLGCPLAEDPVVQGSSYMFAYINAEGYATYYSDANFGATGTPAYYAPTTPVDKNILIREPTYGTTTASTTFQVRIKFKTPFSLDFRPTTTRHFEIVDAVTGELNYSYNYTLDPNTGEYYELVATTTVTQGSKFIRAMYLDAQGGTYSEVDEVFFNVATNTYYTATGLLTPRDNSSGLTQIDCGTFEFGCQFQKALTFLFVPSNNVLDKFKNLWQTIAEKKPFGYVTVTINQLRNLDVSGSSAFTLGTIPFMDSLFTPFRTAIATILWALFAIYFYQNRLKHLDI